MGLWICKLTYLKSAWPAGVSLSETVFTTSWRIQWTFSKATCAPTVTWRCFPFGRSAGYPSGLGRGNRTGTHRLPVGPTRIEVDQGDTTERSNVGRVDSCGGGPVGGGVQPGGRQAEASPAPPTSPGAIATTSVPPTGDPQGQTSTPKVKACDLLTKEEVEEIIGEKIDSVEVQEGWGNCIYHKKENFFGEMMYIPRVTVGYTRTDVQARWNYWSSRTDKEVVTGVGDEAVWSPGMGFFVSRVKGGLLMISVGGATMPLRRVWP